MSPHPHCVGKKKEKNIKLPRLLQASALVEEMMLMLHQDNLKCGAYPENYHVLSVISRSATKPCFYFSLDCVLVGLKKRIWRKVNKKMSFFDTYNSVNTVKCETEK